MMKKKKTLHARFSIITFFIYLSLISIPLIACYLKFSRSLMNTYRELGTEILNLASTEINADKIPSYLSGNYDKKEYEDTIRRLNRYTENIDRIYYLYACKINENTDDAVYIFDTSVSHDKTAEAVGTLYELEPKVKERIEEFRQGKAVAPIADNSKRGYLMTCFKPLIDSHGVCQGYLMIDFNLTALRKDTFTFIFLLAIGSFLFMLFSFKVGTTVVAKRITSPIEKMSKCLSDFKYATNEDIEENISKFQNLNIHTNQEIQSLYDMFLSTMWRSYEFQRDLESTTEQLDDMEEKATTDVLTKVGNKYAYEEKVKDLQERLDNGEKISFAVIMADINNLKYVNDTFGHEKGDRYIKGCLDILAKFFDRESIYRIGGDEFVIFVENRYYRTRYLNLDKAVQEYKELMDIEEDMKPYERYSMSLGISDYDSHNSVISIVKEADEEMYAAKKKFKEKYGSYR